MSNQTQPVIFLKGKRVILRPLTSNNIPNMTRWINDPEVRRFLNNRYPMYESNEQEWIDRLEKNRETEIVLGINVIKEEEEIFIGTMGIHGIHPINRTATTGTMIGEKEYWGKGYATEAKMLLLHYLFNTLNIRKVYSKVFELNKGSLAYAEKCGYKEEGRLPEDIFHDGQYWSEIILAVYQKDFPPLWEEYKKEYLS